jgi:two-component system, OmpR family, sensor histidine kinase ResE
VIRNSVVAKLWLTIIGLVIVVLVILSFYLQQLFDSFIYNTSKSVMEERGTEIATVLEQVPNSELGLSLARQLAAQAKSNVAFITGPLDQDPDTRTIFQNLTPDERAAFLKGHPVARRTTHSLLADQSAQANDASTDSWWVYTPLVGRGSTALQGILVLNQSIEVTDKSRRYISDLILFAVGLGIVLTTGLAFVVSKNLSRPLIQMNEVAMRMAKGDFHGEVNVTTRDEVGTLGLTFNYLVNQLKMTIEALSKEKEQLSGIITSMHDIVISSDLNGKIMLANPSAIKWLRNWSLAEKGHIDTNQLPPNLYEMEQRVLKSGEVHEYELNWQGRDYVAVVTPLYEQNGETMRGVVVVLRDVTEERKLDRLRKDFVANVSHELRTPLSMLQGYSEALLDGFDDDPESRKELTSIILDETLRMRRLVNDLLDLAQLESGHFAVSQDEVNVTNLVRRVARKYSTLASERNIQMNVYIADPSQDCMVLGSEDRLEQVLINLIDNALRHTPEHGSVTMRVERETEHCKIQIQDTGSGIPQADLPFIWERFYKVDKARTRSKGGTGLGLAIARNIVHSHKGDIWVASQEGVGTTFTILLPLHKLQQNDSLT